MAPIPWTKLDYVLVDLSTGEPVAGYEPPGLLQGIGFDMFLKPLVVAAGPEHILANYLLFFRDAEHQQMAWGLECMPTIPFVHQLFTFKCPLLKLGPSGSRMVIKSFDGEPLVAMVDVWKDSDTARGVHRQFTAEGRGHPEFVQALWSAFAVSCGAGGSVPLW